MSKSLIPNWLQPISAAQPCGETLEYDQEFSVLRAKMASKAEIQYGDFTTTPDLPDWAEIERECRRQLLRSKEIDLLIWLLRCRLQRAGTSGLREGLQILRDTLVCFPEYIHPQKNLEGFYDPIVRANALASLTDSDGLISELRDVVIVQNSATRLTVRDVEKAFAIPRQSEALSADIVSKQLHALFEKKQPQRMDMLHAARLAQEINTWCIADLKENAPNLASLTNLLGKFDVSDFKMNNNTNFNPQNIGTLLIEDVHNSEITSSDLTNNYNQQKQGKHPIIKEELVVDPHPAKSEVPKNVTANIQHQAPHSPEIFLHGAPSLALLTGTVSEQREKIRTHIEFVQNWFEQNEPSSPVGILLKQANRFVGKRYSEVINLIPQDLLQRWDEN